MSQRVRLGDLLVQASLVTPEKIEQALARQKETGRRLGQTLVELGYVSEQEVAQVLSNQLSVPWANLRHVDFSRELLNLVSADLAEKWAVIPVYVRRMRKEGETLFVAMDDPLNERALAEVAAHVGLPVRPMVASATELRSAIRAYYGRELPAPPVAPRPVLPSIAPVEIDLEDFEVPSSPPVPAAAPSAPAAIEAEAPSAESAPAAAAGRAGEPLQAAQDGTSTPSVAEPRAGRLGPSAQPVASKRPRMLTLTLLDGTSIALPPRAAAEETGAPAHHHELTTRDLIRALMLHGRGQDVRDVLGDARWETLIAALLAVLVKKGLVADWEFVEIWQKLRDRT